MLAGALVAIVFFAVGLLFTERAERRMRYPLIDAAQVRRLQNAKVVWANQNRGDYPLPSVIDALDYTIAAPAASKDTTANIYSVLIFGGFLTPEILVSRAESNTKAIVTDSDYELQSPHAAMNPANALWDPAFSADFTSSAGGNMSYAHMLPAGDRNKLWADNFDSWLPVVGNRGPEISGVTYDAAGVPSVNYARPHSNTFLFHGSPTAWGGNIAYNDGRVSFENRLAPTWGYAGSINTISVGGKQVHDVLFYDEPDPAASTNAYIGIFIRAGETPADFKAIWD